MTRFTTRREPALVMHAADALRALLVPTFSGRGNDDE